MVTIVLKFKTKRETIPGRFVYFSSRHRVTETRNVPSGRVVGGVVRVRGRLEKRRQRVLGGRVRRTNRGGRARNVFRLRERSEPCNDLFPTVETRHVVDDTRARRCLFVSFVYGTCI